VLPLLFLISENYYSASIYDIYPNEKTGQFLIEMNFRLDSYLY
jgi:hypothetical protein